MENFKQYLPWIIGAAIVLFVLSRLRSRSVLAPQTQITQTPQPDPYAESRLQSFLALVGLAESETQVNRDITTARIAQEISERQQDITERLSIKAFDVDLAKSAAYLNAVQQEISLNFLQRSQDRAAQSAAIDRYYSTRQTSDIIGSINGALSTVFNNRGGIIRGGTPPTFPRNSGFSFGF